MSRRTLRFVPLAAAILAIAAATSLAASDAPSVERKHKAPTRAKEVVVLVRADADGNVFATPETAYVGRGQKLVLFTPCDTLNAKFPKAVARIPDFRCEKNECTLVGPAVTKPTKTEYAVWGKCGEKTFGKDPILIFIP